MALFASLFHLDGHHDSCPATQTVSPEDSDPSLSMIGTTLEFIRIYLDGGLRLLMGGSLDDGTASKVMFPPGNQAPVDSIAFTSGAVTMLLVNVEEERIFRDADPYRRINDEGRSDAVQPDIRLVLYLLFVARFTDYAQGWNHLSALLSQLQAVPVLDRETAPALPAGVERLAFELVSQSFTELNDVWNALRTTHHPSLLYRVRLLSLRDTSASPSIPITELSPAFVHIGTRP
jgi:hypothetical protein